MSQHPYLPPIDQSHQLPPLSSNNAPLQQPFYRLPPASSTPLNNNDRHSQPDPHERPPIAYGPLHHLQSPTEHEDEHEDALAHPGLTTEDSKRSRACEGCRGLKVRCDRDESDPNKPCKRCAKARRQCIVTQPSRKRQKKGDSRVAELEKKIDELSQSLQKQRGTVSTDAKDNGPLSPPQSTNSASASQYRSPPFSTSKGQWKRDMEDRSQTGPSPPGRPDSPPDRAKSRRIDNGPDIETYMANRRPQTSRSDESDIASSIGSNSEFSLDSIVDPDQATRIFDRYVAEMARHLPAVMFEAETTAAEIRSKRPILFLAILDAASVGMLDMEIQVRLNEMLLDVYANSILRNGEKSLDLVQALMVSTIWYRPPKRYEQMNVYMLTHIAALMALDFGMGRKLNASRSARVAANVGQAQQPKSFLRSDSVEARRTWLGCYFVCMNVSLSLRRPNFIRWNSYLDECIKVLESAPETLPSDKRLCQHVKLMHINEEVGIRFSMDDPSATIAISDPRVQFAIGAFEKRLEDWGAGVPKSQWDLSLDFSKHFSRLYMHEIALHHNHNIDDFRAPFTEESLKAPSLQAKSLSPYHNGLLAQCLESVHAMFQTFSAFDLTTVKALPIFYFVRIAYAVVVLIKLRCAVSDLANADLPFRENDLQVEQHLDGLLHTFQKIADQEAFRPARMFMIIVAKLRDGFKANAGKGPLGGGGTSRPEGKPYAIEAGVPDRRKASILSKPGSSASTIAGGSRKGSKQDTSSKPPTARNSISSQGGQVGQPSPQSATSGSTYPTQLQQPQYMPLQHQQYQTPQQYAHHYSDSQAQTPLHFLSEVATGQQQSTSDITYDNAPHQPHQHNPNSGWYPQQIQHPTGPGQIYVDNPMGGYGQQQQQQQQQQQSMEMDPGFETAMDLTMSIGEGDLSSLFMDGGCYGFGSGMIPEGHLGGFAGGGGGGGW